MFGGGVGCYRVGVQTDGRAAEPRCRTVKAFRRPQHAGARPMRLGYFSFVYLGLGKKSVMSQTRKDL